MCKELNTTGEVREIQHFPYQVNKRICDTHLNWGRNLCFNAATDCSLLGLNSLIAILHTLGLLAKHLIHGRSNKVIKNKITTPPNECHNIPFIRLKKLIMAIMSKCVLYFDHPLGAVPPSAN